MLLFDPRDIEAIPEWIACPHRGDGIDVLDASGCGCDRVVYSCSKKGRCLKKLPTARTADSFGSQLDGVTICMDCEIPATEANHES